MQKTLIVEGKAAIIDIKVYDVTEEYLKSTLSDKGVITYTVGYKTGTHKKEVEIGNWIHDNLGGVIVLLKETSDCNKKTPDYLWKGKAWELKSISSAKAADSAFRTAAKQIQENPGGVILELTDDIDMADLEKVLLGRFRRVHLDVLDILIIAQGVLKKILRYKKQGR